MKVENNLLNNRELIWLNSLMIIDFDDKEKLISQINQARIQRHYTDFYLSLKFTANKNSAPVDSKVRVPLEMRVYRNNASPIQFLLHVINGYVSELEVFSADSTEVDKNIRLEKVEVILADELRKK